jgi:transcriptional regulator with XRE-family HTH domain
MKNTNYKSIPNSLRRYRKTRGLKQKEVAKILGLKSTSMISRWEKGLCLPKPLNMFKLAILYRTMADALYYDLRRALVDEIRERDEALRKQSRREV